MSNCEVMFDIGHCQSHKSMPLEQVFIEYSLASCFSFSVAVSLFVHVIVPTYTFRVTF